MNEWMQLLHVIYIKQQNEWTVPSTFKEEKDTNPFLRWHSTEIRTSLGLDANSESVHVFAATRQAKDHF